MARLRRGPSGTEEQAYFNFVYQPHRNADGRTDGILIHAFEITDQVRARQEIETREQQFRRAGGLDSAIGVDGQCRRQHLLVQPPLV